MGLSCTVTEIRRLKGADIHGQSAQLPSKVISGSIKIVDFGTNRKRIFDFLLVINSNRGSILHHFRDTVVYWSKNRKNRQYQKSPLLGVTPFEFRD